MENWAVVRLFFNRWNGRADRGRCLLFGTTVRVGKIRKNE